MVFEIAKRNFPHSLNVPDFDVNFMTRQLNWQYTYTILTTKKGAKNYETNDFILATR